MVDHQNDSTERVLKQILARFSPISTPDHQNDSTERVLKLDYASLIVTDQPGPSKRLDRASTETFTVDDLTFRVLIDHQNDSTERVLKPKASMGT